jgi:adenylate cyclase
MNPKGFFGELKRRNVYKVAAAYAIIGWLLVQIATQVFPFLEIPNWAVRLVIMLVVIGFPIALVIAWAFELTPQGIKRTEVADAMTRPRRQNKWVYVVVIAAAMSIALFFLGRYTASRLPAVENKSAPPPNGQQVAASVPEKSVAVLAFTNLSDDKENEYFSDGISDELGNLLGRVPGLRVSGRNSAFYFKGKNETAQEIGQKLNVSYLVTGSVRKFGSEVRITAQLISTRDGFQVWSSEPLTRELKDIFALQGEIASVVAQNLQLKLDDSARTAKTVNPEAHRLVLEGRHFWNLRTREGFDRAEAAYAKALALDPQFAEAHAARANNFQIRAQYRILDGIGGEEEDQKRALTEAQTAILLDPNLPEAYAAYGYLLHNQGKIEEANQYYEKAFVLNPNYAIAHLWHCQVLDARGQLDAAVEENRLAYELDPLAFIIVDRYAQHLAMAHRFEDALALNQRAAALRTDVWIPNVGERAMTLVALGRNKEAVELARVIRQNSSNWPRWTADAEAEWVLRRCGLVQEADDYAKQLLQTLPQQSYLRGFVLAEVGRFDEALPYLERTPVIFRRNLYWGQNWDHWRNDPRFLQLMVKIGCASQYKIARETLSRMLAQQSAAKK